MLHVFLNLKIPARNTLGNTDTVRKIIIFGIHFSIGFLQSDLGLVPTDNFSLTK